MSLTAWADIDLAALRHNIVVVRRLAPRSKLLALVKADAYGHGILGCTAAIANLVDGFAVARIQEAIDLRQSGYHGRVVLFGTLLRSSDIELCDRHSIEPQIHTPAMAARIAKADLSKPLNCWLHLDSGMHRLGLSEDEFKAAHRLLSGARACDELLLMTHFACADEPANQLTNKQFDRFRAVTDAHAASQRSTANSAAIISRPDTHLDWVRPGIMLYGDNPLAATHPADLRPVMTLKSRVTAIRRVAAGESVGYGAAWIADRESTIATIGIGYGDGYPRQVGNGTPVYIGGERLPIAGRVSMDSVTVDVTAASRALDVGEEVELWGKNIPVSEIAARADTISYHLLTGVTGRVVRRHTNTSA